MKKIKALLCLTIFILTYSKSCLAATDVQDLINSIEADAEELVGGAVAIIENDKIIYKKTFGHKEINSASIDDDTLFGVASVSKAITATALAALVDKKVASFDDKLLINGTNLSLKSILSHTTGFRIRGDNEIERGMSRKELLLKLNKDNKGENKSYFYSNLSYSLTQDYAKSKNYSMDELINALGISSYTLPLTSDNLAYPHSRDQSKLSFPSNYQKTVPASAGVFSSLNGMIEFLQIILGNRPSVVSKKTLNQLFEPIAKADDVFSWNILPFRDDEVKSSYCLGWRKLSLKSVKNSTLIFHSGYIEGATAFVGILPEHKIGIVIMSNQSSRFPLKKGLSFWKTIVGK